MTDEQLSLTGVAAPQCGHVKAISEDRVGRHQLVCLRPRHTADIPHRHTWVGIPQGIAPVVVTGERL